MADRPVVDMISRRRPIIGGLIELLLGKKKEDVATYPDGTKEVIKYEGGILNDRQSLTLLATFIVTTFNLSVETAQLVTIGLHVMEFVGLVVAWWQGRTKVDAQ